MKNNKTPLVVTISNLTAGTQPVKLFDTANIDKLNYGNHNGISINLNKIDVSYEQLMRELLLVKYPVNRIRIESPKPISSFIFTKERIDSTGRSTKDKYVFTNSIVSDFIDEKISEGTIFIGHEGNDSIIVDMKPNSTIDLFVYTS